MFLSTGRYLMTRLARPIRITQPARAMTAATPDKEVKIEISDLVDMQQLFDARCHFGHKEGIMNPHMRPFIFGKRLGVLIIDLEETARLLRHALQVTAEIAYRNGIILFLNRNKQTTHLVENIAKECGEYAHCRDWTNVVFTDSTNVFGAITRLPDLCIFLSTFSGSRPHTGVKMAAKLLIPSIGICDTNSNPTLITYPVPGNDDSPQSILLYAELFKIAILRGKEKRKEVIEKYGEEYYYETIN